MGRNEVKAVRRLGWQQLGDGPSRRVSIHECLRRNEAAGESDVKQPRVSLAPELDGCLLCLAVAQLVIIVHKYRHDPVNKLTWELGIAGEMHPTEFLDRREHS
jgi:hypothetical protein